jgi:hypothetical protein
MTSNSRPFWVCALLAVLSSLVSAGFSIAGLLGSGGAEAFARYAASRSVALPLVAIAAALLRSRGAVLAMGSTMAFVQLFDAVIGFAAHDPSKSYGPLVFALAGFASVWWLSRPKPELST